MGFPTEDKYVPPIKPQFYNQFGGLWTDLNTAEDILFGKLSLNLLTQEDAYLIKHWIDWGYVIIHNAVTEKDIDFLLKDIELTLHRKAKPRKVSYWQDGIKHFEDADD